MSDSDGQYLETFSGWLSGLGDDAQRLSQLLEVQDAPHAARRAVAGGLNYLFKSLDLIPDGIDDIGYLDDAFVLRVSASEAVLAGADHESLKRLASEAERVKAFLGDNYPRLHSYVAGLKSGAARGRTVQEVLGNPKILEDFLADVKGFAASYHPPAYSRDPKSLTKLRAFFDAKLPRAVS